MKQKTVILITGPTASGKTALAIEAALHYNTEIISADSRQCFRELNVGVAKPSSRELEVVKHHFINSHSIHEEVTAATFASYANSAADSIFREKDVLIMAGGTGLYIKAFIEGLDNIPAIDPAVRQHIVQEYESNGLSWLQQEIAQRDPRFFSEGEIKNPQRLIRALEVVTATGKSIKEFHRDERSDNPASKYNIRKFAIDMPRAQLYDNINKRVDRMMEHGLLEEVISLKPYRHLNALQTVGYTELFDYLDGNIPLEAAIDKIKQNTRNYAKRQMTWLRKEKDLRWINNSDELFRT